MPTINTRSEGLSSNENNPNSNEARQKFSNSQITEIDLAVKENGIRGGEEVKVQHMTLLNEKSDEE